MATQQQKTEETRSRLLQAAFELLKTAPFSALTASKITTAAGLSKGALFHHFSQIEDFYLYMLDSIIQTFDGAIQANSATSFEIFLQTSMEITFEMVENSPEVFTAIYSFLDLARFKPRYAQKVRAILEAEMEKWKNDLALYFPPGFSQKRQEGILYLIDMYFSGLGTHYLVLKNKARYKAITQEFITMLSRHINGALS